MESSIRGKWAFVTGASRGVGALISKALAEQGCHVAVHSRELAHTDALVKELQSLGVQAVAVAGELSDPHQVEAMLDTLLNKVPQIDILYNNAAVMTPWRQNPWEFPVADFQKSFEVNVIALARICYRLVPPMLARHWGRVINVTSGIANEPQLTPYAISKAAVDKFVKDFVPALQNTGVQMNLLDPGWLRTDLGGPNAPNDPSTVIPGAIVPAMRNDGVSGHLFRAQEYAGLSLAQAMVKPL